MHGSTRLFYRPLPHVAAARERANLGVRHCIDCVSHAAAVMIANCRDREAVFCACLSYASNSTFSTFTPYLQQSSKQAINQYSINHAPFTIAAATSPRLLRPHWWLWRERRRWKRDDLLSVRLAPHTIQSLITTRTSNCDYLLLPFVYIAYTIHQSSPTAQAMRDIP